MPGEEVTIAPSSMQSPADGHPELDEQLNSTLTGDGLVDYRGRRADKSSTGGWLAAFMIFGTEFIERVGTLGISLNLVTYLVQKMHLALPRAANIVTNYYGTSYITSLVGGFLADSYWGRFWTIAVFASIQFLGMLFLTLTAALPDLRPGKCPQGRECKAEGGVTLAVLYVALYVIALGAGGIKPNVAAFGADQFDRNDSRENRQLEKFFTGFFFFISIGAVISVTVLVWVQDNVGRAWGFGVSAVLMFMAVALLVLGRSFYRYKKPTGSPFTHVARVFVAALRNSNLPTNRSSSHRFELDDKSRLASGREKLGHTHQFRFLDSAALVDPNHDESALAAEHSSWRLTTLTEVEEVKQVLRILPVWVFTILFYTAYAQLTTFSVEQASTMNRRFGSVDSGNFEIPPASLGVFLELGTLAILALYQPIIVPLARLFTRSPLGLTSLQKIGCGLFFGTLGMVIAAIVELKRIHYVDSRGYRNSKDVLPLSVFWLLPQYFIIGVGEALIYVGQLEFFYKESPDGMRSLGTALFLTSIALGFFASSGVVSEVKRYSSGEGDPNGWLDDNLNQAQLYNFYWLLAIVSAINLVFFLCAATWYKYKKVEMLVVVPKPQEGSHGNPSQADLAVPVSYSAPSRL